MNIEREIPSSPTVESRFSAPNRQTAAILTRERLFILLGGLVLSLILGMVAAYLDSLFAVMLVIIATVGVVAVLKPEMTTVFISFAFYVNLPVVAIRYGGVPPTIAGAIFLALGLPMLHALVIRRQRVVINTALVLMTAYFAVLLLSAVFSNDFTLSLDRILSFALEGFVLYFLFINTIRTPETLKKVVWALIAAGILMGSLSIIQEVTGNYENEFFGLAQTKDTELTVGEANIFDDAPTARRLAGPIGSKNRYAQIMLVLLPLAILQIFANSNRTLKIIAAMSLVPIVAGALLTYSRGAGITLIALLAALLVLRLLPVWKTVLIGAAACLLILIFLPGFAYRFGSVIDVTELFSDNAQEADGAIRGRATVNLAGIQLILMNPVLGVGPGQSPLYTREIGNEIGFRWLETDRRLHNMYLEEAADTGLIGFGLFMSIVAVTLKQLNAARIKWRGKNPEYYYVVIGLMLAIFAYLVTAVFLHLSYVRYYWFLLALAGAAAHILLKHSESEPSTQEIAR